MEASFVSSSQPINLLPQGEIRTAKSELGMDDFLKLLTTQLTSQDPLSPMQDTDFIAQMANFSSLTQMEIMSKNMELLRAQQDAMSIQSMIGKHVRADLGEEGIIEGKITHVERVGEKLVPFIGDRQVPFNSIYQISASGPEAGEVWQ